MNFTGIKKYIVRGLIALVLITGSGIWWGYAHLTTLVQARLKAFTGTEIVVGNVTARWNRIELDQVSIPRSGSGPFAKRFSIDRIVIHPSLLSLFSGRLDIREIHLDKPFLLLEINPDGSFAKILSPAPPKPSGSSAAALPVRISAVRITGGTIDVLDWQVARKNVIGISNPRERYHLTGLREVSFTAGVLDIPLSDQPVPVRLELAGKGGGRLLIAGNVAPKGLDSRLKLDLTGLNIIPYRPYFQKKGDLNISSGNISATSSLTINKRILNAPGSLQLKGLAFDHSDTKGVLMGIPAWALVSFMSDHKDELAVTFTVNGSLDNPRFSAHQSFIDQIATALSSKIGVSTVTDVGKGILGIGEKSIKGILGITGLKK
jgi:hypothetical protein